MFGWSNRYEEDQPYDWSLLTKAEPATTDEPAQSNSVTKADFAAEQYRKRIDRWMEEYAEGERFAQARKEMGWLDKYLATDKEVLDRISKKKAELDQQKLREWMSVLRDEPGMMKMLQGDWDANSETYIDPNKDVGNWREVPEHYTSPTGRHLKHSKINYHSIPLKYAEQVDSSSEILQELVKKELEKRTMEREQNMRVQFNEEEMKNIKKSEEKIMKGLKSFNWQPIDWKV